MPRSTSLETTKNLALIEAAVAENNTKIQELISAKANVNTQDSDGNTPLMLSGSRGNLNGVEILIKAKANIALTNHKGKKFIDIVCDKEYNSSFLGRLSGLNLLKIKTDPTKNEANKLCLSRENIVVNPELFLTDNDLKGLKLIQATLGKNHLEMHDLIDNRAPVNYQQVSDNRTALMLALSHIQDL